IVPDAIFEQEQMRLSDCQYALMYTDGVTEAADAAGQLFGQERLMGWLAQLDGKPTSAAMLQQQFQNELQHFQGAAPLRDDQTFLLLAQEPQEALTAPS